MGEVHLVLGYAHWGASAVPVTEMIELVKEIAGDLVRSMKEDGKPRKLTIDVAPHYGNGAQERVLAAALLGLTQEERDIVEVSTKGGRVINIDKPSSAHNGFTNRCDSAQEFNYTAEGIMLAFTQSQLRLGLPRFSTYFLHDLDRDTHPEDFDKHWNDFIESGYAAMNQLKAEGKIKEIGIGSNNIETCLNLIRDGKLNIDRIMIAGCYNLLDTSALDMLIPLCKEKNIKIDIAAPYAGGILSGKEGNYFFKYKEASSEIKEKVEEMKKVCERFRIELPHAAMQLAHMHPQIDRVVVGARTREEWARSYGFAENAIRPEFWQALKDQGFISRACPVTVSMSYLSEFSRFAERPQAHGQGQIPGAPPQYRG